MRLTVISSNTKKDLACISFDHKSNFSPPPLVVFTKTPLGETPNQSKSLLKSICTLQKNKQLIEKRFTK